MNVIILITSTTWISLRCRDYSQKLAWILASFVTEKTGWKKWEPKPEVCVARSNKRNCCSATATRKEQIEWAMQSVTVCGPWKKTLASCGQKVKHYSCMNEEWVLCPGGRREADEKVNLLLVLALVGMANISTKKIRNHYMESIGYWTSPRRCAIFAGSIWISTYLRLLSVIFPPDRKVILAPWPKFLTKPKRSLAEYWLQNSS